MMQIYLDGRTCNVLVQHKYSYIETEMWKTQYIATDLA
jgi:hypothetical protein